LVQAIVFSKYQEYSQDEKHGHILFLHKAYRLILEQSISDSNYQHSNQKLVVGSWQHNLHANMEDRLVHLWSHSNNGHTHESYHNIYSSDLYIQRFHKHP